MESESKPVDKTSQTSTFESQGLDGVERAPDNVQAGSRPSGERPPGYVSSQSQSETMDPVEIGEIQERKPHSSALRPSGTESSTSLSPHHYRMLDTVLDQAPAHRCFKQPMVFDIILAIGLLVAVSGFTTGLMRIYITHMAKQSINQHNYKAAITILKRSPVPEFFSGFGSNPNELLNQARYLDALTKLEANNDDQAALSQLSEITAGSRYFHLAQEILREKSQPSTLKLESGATKTHVASPEEINAPAQPPLFPEEE